MSRRFLEATSMASILLSVGCGTTQMGVENETVNVVIADEMPRQFAVRFLANAGKADEDIREEIGGGVYPSCPFGESGLEVGDQVFEYSSVRYVVLRVPVSWLTWNVFSSELKYYFHIQASHSIPEDPDQASVITCSLFVEKEAVNDTATALTSLGASKYEAD